jgi:adenosine deaminase
MVLLSMDEAIIAAVQALPKIDLHRHLEGSVRLETLVEIAREYGIEMPEYDVATLRPFVQMMPGETHNVQHFLGKFHTLRQFFRSPEIIQRVTREAIADAASDNIRYLELRFTPPALASIMECPFDAVIEWVCLAVAEAEATHDIQVRLILSMNRHESVRIGRRVLKAAMAFRDQGVVALDLAGNEQDFSAKPFRKLFEEAKSKGLGVTIHAGEWAGAQNVQQAVTHLGADRVGHGVRVIEDPALVEWLAERGVVLEVCPTSNVQSGVVADWAQHPLIRLYRQGVLTTINTDDPVVSNITLSSELTSAVTYMALTMADVKQHILNAAQSVFLPEAERKELISRFETWLDIQQ